MAEGFLQGITVLDLASVGPAARASRWLADYGATVVKVGPVPARGGVQIRPPFHAYSGHRGMKRVQLDLKSPEGRDAFLLLAAEADVVIESFRPGVVDRLGIGYESVKSRNPAVVYCSTTGYGQDGPRSHWAGHDLNYLAVGGFLHCGGRGPDGGPVIPGATVADSAGGGMHAVMSILAALVRRGSSGEGAYLDVAVADGLVALMALQIDEYLATGQPPGPRHGLLTGRYACYDSYCCADGGWLSVAAIEPKFWANLCEATGCAQWAGHQLDDAVQDEIRADLRAAFASRSRDEWTALLGPNDTCVAPVLTVEELVADEQFVARRLFSDATHAMLGRVSQVAPALAGMSAASDVTLPDDEHTDTDVLLGAAGIEPADLARLRASGVLA